MLATRYKSAALEKVTMSQRSIKVRISELTDSDTESQGRVLKVDDHGEEEREDEHNQRVNDLVEFLANLHEDGRKVVEGLEVDGNVEGSDPVEVLLSHFVSEDAE